MTFVRGIGFSSISIAQGMYSQKVLSELYGKLTIIIKAGLTFTVQYALLKRRTRSNMLHCNITRVRFNIIS